MSTKSTQKNSPPVPCLDVVALCQDIIRIKSVTPQDCGAIAYIGEILQSLGCEVTFLPFSGGGAPDTQNLFARIGTGRPLFCFAGHSDVVPAGRRESWQHDPFAGEIKDGILYGRGAVDMKGGVAAFIVALSQFLQDHEPAELPGAIGVIITGNEEGDWRNGTVKIMEWLDQHNLCPDACIVGEPTNPDQMGQVIKIGRRGSLNCEITVEGRQGHVAYPHHAANPLPVLLDILTQLTSHPLDEGDAYFVPSNLEIVGIFTDNDAYNVIPGHASARLNIRFNTYHCGTDLQSWIQNICNEAALPVATEFMLSGESFVTPPGDLSQKLVDILTTQYGRAPRLDTGGGTSDARFISQYCPVVEYGLVSATIHQSNERTPINDLQELVTSYRQFLSAFFR